MVEPLTEVVGKMDGEEIFRAVLRCGEYAIGREIGIAIELLSPRISRRHARLTLNYFDWMIEDTQSINGTFVSGQRITEPTLIFPNQDVRVGNVQLHLQRVPRNDHDEMPAPQVEAVRRFIPERVRDHRKYKIHRVIALGGMGAVLEAEDLATRRRVAMKVLLSINSHDDVARFVEEAQITAQLEHPHIVPVHELGVNELDKPFFTMRLVSGDSLTTVLTQLRAGKASAVEQYSLDELLAVIQRVSDAIAFAHSKGVVHRDLKPDNIMLGAFGETIVLDWGLAKPLGKNVDADASRDERSAIRSSAREDEAPLNTIVGTALGTPQYMSPEQASGESHAVDARADVYGLGALLYSILTLRPPVDGFDPREIVDKVAAGEIIAPADAVRRHVPPHLPDGKMPPELAAIAMKALALKPADRFESVREMQAAVRTAQFGEKKRSFFGVERLFGARKPPEPARE